MCYYKKIKCYDQFGEKGKKWANYVGLFEVEWKTPRRELLV